jgi:hypothetical protein
MTLNNYKIPIIVGRNDIPTTNINQSNHPNGAFLVNKYNGLINELITNGVTTGGSNEILLKDKIQKTSINIFVDSIEGNDSNDGSQLLPFKSIEKAFSILQDLYHQVHITLTGEFINPIIDCSNIDFFLSFISVSPYIHIYGGTIRWNKTFINNETDQSIFIKGITPIKFWDTNFVLQGNESFPIFNNNLTFKQCILESLNAENPRFFIAENSKICLEACSFLLANLATLINNFFYIKGSHCVITLLDFDRLSFNIVHAEYSTTYVDQFITSSTNDVDNVIATGYFNTIIVQ